MNTKDVTPFKDQRFDQPGEGTESEAEQQLKRMVQNQLDTTLTIERYRAQIYRQESQGCSLLLSVDQFKEPTLYKTLALNQYLRIKTMKNIKAKKYFNPQGK